MYKAAFYPVSLQLSPLAPQSNPCQHPIIILQNVTPSSLDSLLHFMYNGEVQVTHEVLTDFLRTAELLQVKGLSEAGLKHHQLATAATALPTHTEVGGVGMGMGRLWVWGAVIHKLISASLER